MSKPAKCIICKAPFQRFQTFQRWCSVDCGAVFAMNMLAKKSKQERKEHRAKKEALKSRSDWMKEAQTAFNSWIRARDEKEPCISCQRHHNGQYHAGHFLSVGARPELRFQELNCHKQCSTCNLHLSGNLLLYRKSLIAKIGIDMVEWLEGPHDAKHYSIEDLKAIKKKYSALARELRGK